MRKLVAQDRTRILLQDRHENSHLQSHYVHTIALMCPRFKPYIAVPVSYWTRSRNAAEAPLSKCNDGVESVTVSSGPYPALRCANLIKGQCIGKGDYQQNGWKGSSRTFQNFQWWSTEGKRTQSERVISWNSSMCSMNNCDYCHCPGVTMYKTMTAYDLNLQGNWNASGDIYTRKEGTLGNSKVRKPLYQSQLSYLLLF